MNYFVALAAILGIAITAGGISVWFKRGQGNESIKLLQTNIAAYKDAEKLKDQRIAYLEGQVYSKDETIKRLSEEKR